MVAVVLALASLRLRGLGLALMTIAAALFFDNSVFTQINQANGHALTVQAKWVGLGILNANGHALFVLSMIVLLICVIGVTLVHNGTTGRYLTAMRGSETAAAGIGINLTWQRILIFAISGVVAGIGGTILTIQQQSVNAEQFNYQLSLAFVVIVVTTGVSSIEGAIQAGMGYVIVQQLLTYLPSRYGGGGLTFVLFAFGALTYAAHPEGILEFQKRRWTLRFERLIFHNGSSPDPPDSPGRNGGASAGTRSPSAHLPWTEAMPAWPRPNRGHPVKRPPEVPITRGGHGRVAPLDGSLVSVAGVTKSFGGIAAVRDVSLTIEHGESVGLVGPNGAGKTTLFNCICGQLRQDDGTIVLGGTVLDGLPTYQRARLGIGRTYQRVEVFSDMTVREHLLVAERARGAERRLWRDLCNRSSPTSSELARVDEVLDLIGLADRADIPVSALGLGSCRLVELARALVSDPTLLLADEPSSGLDVTETQELAHVLRTLQRERGMTVLLVERDLQMVADVIDRAVVMDLGEVIAHGTFDEVMADPAVRHAYLGITG